MNHDAVALLAAKRSALDILAAEHHAFDSALASLVESLGLARAHRIEPDPGLFERGVSYLATFMDRFHHPKEDEFLFKALRERTREADDLLASLQEDHARGPAQYRDLGLALAHLRSNAATPFEDFAALLERYAREQLEHMRQEAELLLPIAERALRLSDWPAIDAGFRAHRDPLFGPGGGGRTGLFAVPVPAR